MTSFDGRMLPSNLKFRLTSVVVVLVLAATVIVTLLALIAAERGMKGVIGEQQYAMISSAATFIDDRLLAKKRLITGLARSLPAGACHNPTLMHDFLSSRQDLHEDFINLSAFGSDGMLLATLYPPPAAPISAVGKQYFEATRAAQVSIVSDPFESRLTNAKVVVVTAPVLDAHGKLQCMLTAGIDLEHWSFLKHVDTLKPGKTGFIFVMTGKGILLHHPNRDRLLQHINQRQGVNEGTQKALAGFEGWLEATNKDGSDGIYSYRHLRAADWIVGARFPMDEAFAPMIAIQRHAMLMAALVAVIAGILALLFIYRLFAPLEALRRNVSAIRKQRANIDVLQVARDDEIGELSLAFHALMAEREVAVERTSESERRARIIADAVPALISYINSDLRYEFSNANYERVMGVSPAGMIGKTVREILGEPIYATIEARLLAALNGVPQHFEQEVTARGVLAYLLIDYIPNVAENGEVRGVYVLALDISQRKQDELTQAASEKRLKLITDNLPVLIAYLDSEHCFRFGNATFEKWFGIAPQDLVGRPLVDVVGEENYALARLHLENAFGGWAVTYEVKASVGGTLRMLETTYVPDIQANGAVAGVYALTHDMTRMKDVEEKLMQLARADTLTGIANRRMFGENLQHAIDRAHRHAGSMALAYLDIDHFKKINDTHGHGVGDEVLKEFARRLVDNVRATDAVARLSGDEFVIILEDLKGALEINTVASKVIGAIRVPIATSIGPLAVTASVGIALFYEGQTDEELLARADAALYAAKRTGRDRFNVDGW